MDIVKVNSQELEEIAEIYGRKFIDEYKRIAYHKYFGILKTNPEALRLYDELNVQVIYYMLNDNYFSHNSYMAFIYKRNANMSVQVLDLTDVKYYQYDTHSFDKKEKDILIEAVEDVSKKDIISNSYVPTNSLYALKEETEPSFVVAQAEYALRVEAQNFNSHINHKQEYYAKNAARYAYSELDLNPIIDRVNDEDFSYQLDQAIAAYDNSLYLASCATLGVCLETVCKLLLTKNGVKIKDSDSTLLDNLTAKLRENKLISFKMKGRIDVCYKVRNLAAHTSPGKIVKSDCHFILNTISEIVEEHFQSSRILSDT